MQGFVKVFLPAFFLFAIVGGVAGFGSRYDRAKMKVYRTLEVRYDPESGEGILLSSCNEPGGVAFEHFIDSDVTKPVASTSRLLRLLETSLRPASDKHMQLAGILGGFLGGATGGFKLKDVLKMPGAKGWKKTIWGFAGAVTGYAGGHYLTSHYGIGCDSRLMARLRKDSAAWIGFERMKIGLTWKELQSIDDAWLDPETGEAKYRWDEDPVYRCAGEGLARWEAVIEPVLTQTIDNPRSSDFQAVDRIKRFHDRLRGSPAYETLVKLRSVPELGIEFGDALKELGWSKDAWEQACAELKELALEF